MEYFALRQDERFANVPVLQEVQRKIELRHIQRLKAEHLSDTTLFHVRADQDADYPDLLTNQLFLVSERVKQVLEMHEPDCSFKLVPLIDLEHSRQALYYLPLFPEIEALSPYSEFNLDRSVLRRPVLEQGKLGNRRMFQVKESMRPLIVIRLEVAEGLLRRDLIGIGLQRLEVL